VAGYFRGFLGHRFASTKSAARKTESFVREIMALVRREKITLVRFEKGVRKDEVMKKALRKFRRQAPGDTTVESWPLRGGAPSSP
jgi:hypothetical protein